VDHPRGATLQLGLLSAASLQNLGVIHHALTFEQLCRSMNDPAGLAVFVGSARSEAWRGRKAKCLLAKNRCLTMSIGLTSGDSARKGTKLPRPSASYNRSQ
jgi:hypothetical protein